MLLIYIGIRDSLNGRAIDDQSGNEGRAIKDGCELGQRQGAIIFLRVRLYLVSYNFQSHYQTWVLVVVLQR